MKWKSVEFERPACSAEAVLTIKPSDDPGVWIAQFLRSPQPSDGWKWWTDEVNIPPEWNDREGGGYVHYDKFKNKEMLEELRNPTMKLDIQARMVPLTD